LLWLMEAWLNCPAAREVARGFVNLALSQLEMEGKDVPGRLLNGAEKKIAKL